MTPAKLSGAKAKPQAARATRRRGATLEQALLEAAWTELQESGYSKLTMERVAERAGTSRAVIYRRWRNRAELVVAAMRYHQPVYSGSLQDTGTLRGDVLLLLRRALTRITEIGPGTVVGLLNDLLSDSEGFEDVLNQLTRSGGEVMGGLLTRAQARGEARADISPRIARLPIDLLRYELFLTHETPSATSIQQIVDEIFLPLVLTDPSR